MPAARHISPIAVRESSAAAMLDLPVTKFRDLVSRGSLPPPVRIADGIERWRVEDLAAILSGKAARPQESEGFEL